MISQSVRVYMIFGSGSISRLIDRQLCWASSSCGEADLAHSTYSEHAVSNTDALRFVAQHVRPVTFPPESWQGLLVPGRLSYRGFPHLCYTLRVCVLAEVAWKEAY